MFDTIRMGAAGAGGAYEIEKSLRFNRSDAPRLVRTSIGTPTNNKIATWSAWIKLTGSSGVERCIFGGMNTATGWNNMWFNINASHIFVFYAKNSSNNVVWNFRSKRVFRDYTGWMHVFVVMDTPQNTEANRLKVYFNGVEETIWDTSGYGHVYPAQDLVISSWCESGENHYIGVEGSSNSESFDGYLAEMYYIDGQAKAVGDFGETNEDTGQWVPKEYDGTYGDNGFFLPFTGDDLNTAFTDSSANARTVSTFGSPVHSTTQKKVGATSIRMATSTDTIDVPDSSDFDFGSDDWTLEGWFRRDAQGGDEWLMVQTDGTSANTSIGLHIWSTQWGGSDANKASIRMRSGSSNLDCNGTTLLAANTWYHIAGVRDGNTLRIYVNGVQENTTSISGSVDTSSAPFAMGSLRTSDGAAGLTGYMDELRVSDNCRYTSGTTFTPSTTAFSSDSNTLILIHSDNSGTDLAADASGNDNHFTANNIILGDSVPDTPTNNFATLRMVSTPYESGASISDGNLKFVSGSGTSARNQNKQAISSFLVNSGKWYAEIRAGSANAFFGVGPYQVEISPTSNNSRYVYIFAPDGDKYVNTNGSESIASYGSSYTTGDILGIYLDMDAGTPAVYFSKNGQWADGSGNFDESSPTSAITLGNDFLTTSVGGNSGYCGFIFSSSGSANNVNGVVNFGQDSTFAGQETAGGNTDSESIGDFKYTVPTGAKALCTANLPEPTIKNGSDYFNTVLYTGNNSTNVITGVGFQPDLFWIKDRSTTGEDHHVFDSVRGLNKAIYANQTSAESDGFDGGGQNNITAVGSDGFTITGDGTNGEGNLTGRNYVAWNWKESATAGFDIVGYTGTGSTPQTRAHSLGVAPEMMIVKSRSGTDGDEHWVTYHHKGHATPQDYFGRLNTDGDWEDNIIWNDTAPTSSVFTTADNAIINTNTHTYIAYLFASVEGYSKVGSYTGNGNADGPTVFMGFKPAFVLIKRTDADEDWWLYDNVRDTGNPHTQFLYANTTTAEQTGTGDNIALDFISNGIKLRTANVNWNASGGTYIYLAFAETPFKYATAR